MSLLTINIHAPIEEVEKYIPSLYNLFDEFKTEMNIPDLFEYHPDKTIIDSLPLFSEWAMKKYNLYIVYELQENPRQLLTINLGWEDMSVEENQYLFLNMYPEDFNKQVHHTGY